MPSRGNLRGGEITSEPEYPNKDVTHGVFSFGSSGFHIDSFERATSKSLRKLLFPELLPTEQARRSACIEAAEAVCEEWVIAQLQHYGIGFHPEIGGCKAKALLVTNVAHGMCDNVPPQVLSIKMDLKGKYEAQMKNYYVDMEAYRVQQLPKRLARFEACVSPTEEAKCDPSLFLRKYFLDEQGEPDKAKTPALLLLPGYQDRALVVTGRTERIPALHVADAGRGGVENTMIIGWDRARVNGRAKQIDAEHNVTRAKDDWHTQMLRHREYKTKLQSGAKTTRPFDPYNTCGIYIMHCQAVERDWPNLTQSLRLRMMRGGRVGIFDLGIVTGLMVFAESQRKVAKLVADGTWNSDLLDAVDSDSEDATTADYYEYMDDTEYDLEDREDDIDDSSHSRRLYFQWRGYNTRTGEKQHDPSGRNTGYIQFEDDAAVNFSGSLNIGILGPEEVPFEGYKIPGLAGPLNMNWDALSHLASDRAKVPKHVW
ncbi:MAG: hypothetical protein Q9171_006451 [Xanthocarpia ochracea]